MNPSGSDSNSTGVPNAAINVVRGHKVDLLTTKDIDLKGRKVIGGAPASEGTDYVIFDQLNQSIADLSASVQDTIGGAFTALAVTFQKSWTTILKLVTSLIAPPSDSVSAIQFLRADKATPVIIIDTLNGRLGVAGGVYSTQGDHNTLPNVAFIRMQYDPSGYLGYFGDLVVYDPVAPGYLPLSVRANPITLGYAGSKIAFFDSDRTHAALKQILSAYVPQARSGSFVGIASGVAGTPYAQVADLESLRAGYENLRVAYEDLRAKIQSSTLIG